MTPDERVARYLLERFKATRYSVVGRIDMDDYAHLRGCAETVLAVDEEGVYDGRCGEGTCDMLGADTVVSCPHGRRWNYHYSELGDVADLMAYLARMDDADG